MCHHIKSYVPIRHGWVWGWRFQSPERDDAFLSDVTGRTLYAYRLESGWLLSDPSWGRHDVAITFYSASGTTLGMNEGWIPPGLYAYSVEQSPRAGVRCYNVAAKPAWLSWASDEQWSASHLLCSETEKGLADLIEEYEKRVVEAWQFRWEISGSRMVSPVSGWGLSAEEAKAEALEEVLTVKGFAKVELEAIDDAPTVITEPVGEKVWAVLGCRFW